MTKLELMMQAMQEKLERMERREGFSKDKERLRDLADATKEQMQARPMMFPVTKPEKFLDKPGEPVMDFETWKGLFESYMDACLLQGADETSMMAVFKISMGWRETRSYEADPSNVEH